MKPTQPWSTLLEITIIVTVSCLIIFGAFATIIQMHQEMLAAESGTRFCSFAAQAANANLIISQ